MASEKLILDFFSMRVTKERDPSYCLCLSRSMTDDGCMIGIEWE